MTDDLLVQEIRAGLPGAFKRLVETYQHKVLNTCFRFVADRTDAEDIAQDTFIEIHRSLAKFRGDSSLATWIYQIAVSKSLDFMRKKNRKKRKSIFGSTIRIDDQPVEIPASDSENPEKKLQEKERRAVLQEALDSLPRNQRAAFVLSKYDGMSYQEIAKTLKTTVGAVESLIHRAKKNLQKKLFNYYKEHMK